jgi:hypothetical protein
MATSTPLKPIGTTELRLQTVSRTCRTQRKRTFKIGILYLLIVAAGVLAAVWAYHHFQPAALTHPDFEEAALTGTPQVEERYGYSTLNVDETYLIRLCGVPANDGQAVDFYFTNPPESGVWFRAEVLSEGGQLLASTGVLRPGEYLPTVTLNQELTQQETPVTVRIVAYEPDTWQSRGNVNLNLTLYLKYT